MTETAADLGTIVVVIAGMAFVVLGLLQYVANFTKRQGNRREKLFDELEQCRLELVKVRGDYAVMRGKAIRYRKIALQYKGLYESLKTKA